MKSKINIPDNLLEEAGLTKEEVLRKVKKRKPGRPKLNKDEREQRRKEREAIKLLSNHKKHVDAIEKPRVGGRFISLDPSINEAKKDREALVKTISEQAFITDEDREFFGTDSKLFFERALNKASTWVEGMVYARELKNLQHAALSSQQVKTEVEVTHKVLKWEWEGMIEADTKTLIEGNVIDGDKGTSVEGAKCDEGAGDRDTLQADAVTSKDTQ